MWARINLASSRLPMRVFLFDEAMEEREQATSKNLSRAPRALRRGDMLSGGSGGSDSLSPCAELAAADAEERGPNPVGDMESSVVVVQHEKGYQFFGMSEGHVTDPH